MAFSELADWLQTTRRFAIVNDEDINKIVDNAIPKNTKRGTKFGNEHF